MFTTLETAIVPRIEWLEKNALYDQQINLLVAKNHQVECE